VQPRNNFIFKIHLIISVIIVIPVAILYGWFPELTFDLFPNTMDEMSFYKAVMGLYLAFSLLWLLGIFNSNYFRVALISNMVFMLGLGFGRTISLLIDGVPGNAYLIGAFGEIALGLYGLWALKKSTTFELK